MCRRPPCSGRVQASRGTIALTHLHWDHVHGLPFFRGGDRDDARVRLLLPAQTDGTGALAALARGMSPPHFPSRLISCAVTGSSVDLVAVSPRSGRAVSSSAAEPYADRLLRLPSFVSKGGPGSWDDIADGLELTGHFLTRDVLTDGLRNAAHARSRLVERLRRAGGLA